MSTRGGSSRREPTWAAGRVRRTIWVAVITAFCTLPTGLALGAWTIFQPAAEPMIGPIPAVVVAGALLCLAAGWYAGFRKHRADQGREAATFGYWPTYVLAAFAAGAFAVWAAYGTAQVHTPEVSLASAHPAQLPGSQQPSTSTPTAAPPPSSESPVIDGGGQVPRETTCAGGKKQACANVEQEIDNTIAGFAQQLNTLCGMVRQAATDPASTGWTPPSQMITTCNRVLDGSGSVKTVAAEAANAKELFNELSAYAGWPPIR